MYCLYLRKSRADLAAEARGEGETLKKHEQILLDTAGRLKLPVSAVYKELVSGESIRDRPVIKQLLNEVSNGLWKGVLVVEIERLARGDTEDQGIIAKAFRYSGTRIITPVKTYNPENEFDEEYFEFGLFMSRREYKTINRRMRQGIRQAARDGCWPYNRAPYGYQICRLPDGRGYSLIENPVEKSIYNILMQAAAFGPPDGGGRLGDSANARYLNRLGLSSRSGRPWTPSGVRSVRTNPVQTGKVIYGRRAQVKKLHGKAVMKSRPRNQEYEIFQGLHSPLIDDAAWKNAQRPFSRTTPTTSAARKTAPKELKNPLAGIVKCGICKRSMVRRPRPGQPPLLICPYADCPNISSALHSVEETLLSALRQWLRGYTLLSAESPGAGNARENLKKLLGQKRKELSGLLARKERLHTLLEENIYSVELFDRRLLTLETERETLLENMQEIEHELSLCEHPRTGQTTWGLLETYPLLTPSCQNALLKELVCQVFYIKRERNTKGHPEKQNFTLDVHPRLPKHPEF